MHNDDRGESNREQVILNTMTLPVAEPVNKEAELPVNFEHGDRGQRQALEKPTEGTPVSCELSQILGSS